MKMYICECCKFSSKLKSNYQRHLATNKHEKNYKEYTLMNPNEPKMNQNEPKMNQNEPVKIKKIKKFKCSKCDETFNTHASKRRHELHRCKEMVEINKIIKEKNKQIEKLEKKVDKLTDKIGNTTIMNTTNTTNNLTNNIKINSYGKEDLSYISDEFKTSLLSVPYNAINKMIEEIHFNDNKPENKNIIYPNVNKNIMKVKCGNKWVHKNKDLIILDMIDSKYLMLDDHYNLVVNGETLSKFTKDIFNKFRKKYDNGDKKLINNLKDNCELMLLDKREQ